MLISMFVRQRSQKQIRNAMVGAKGRACTAYHFIDVDTWTILGILYSMRSKFMIAVLGVSCCQYAKLESHFGPIPVLRLQLISKGGHYCILQVEIVENPGMKLGSTDGLQIPTL